MFFDQMPGSNQDEPDGFADYYDAVRLTAADYFPFGLEMEGRTISADNHRFGFNGKEKDPSISSLTHYDYGFRIYNPAIGRFLSVDPLMDAHANIGTSPYAYVWNNPLQFIDPTGMIGEIVDNTYGVDSKGNINKIDEKKHYDKDGNEVDLLVVGKKVRVNKRGEIKNAKIEVELGRLQQATKRRSILIGKEEYDYTYLNFGENAKGANKLFTFLAESTDVEWAIFQKDKGFAKITEVFSSHIHDKEVVGASLLSSDPKGLIYHTHSHPRTHKMLDYSRLRPSDEDKSFAEGIRKTVPSAKFYIHFNFRKLLY